MKITAFDLSLSCTGWAIHREGDCLWGTISSKPMLGPYGDLARLQYVVNEVGEIARYSDLSVLEGFAFARPNQSHILGALGYMVRMWLWKHEIPFVLVAPATLKKWTTGSGKAKKDVMLREVCRRWDVVIDDDNAADAYALLRLGEALVGQYNEDLTEFQKQVVKMVHKNQRQVYENLLP